MYKKILFLLCLNTISGELPVKWANIVIHGTFGLRAYLSFGTFLRLWQDQVDCSDYDIGVQAMRRHRGFYILQPMQEMGLNRIVKNNLGSHVFMQIFQQVQQMYCDDMDEIFYTYGWSGVISHKNRVRESLKLYDLLNIEHVKLSKQYNCEIKFRIIGYSHGGNIALQLAHAHEKSANKASFKIGELILIGTPLKMHIKHMISSELFEKVYNIYSKADHIQHLDIFSPCAFFSNRYFHKVENEICYKKLKQIEIQVAKSRPNVINNSVYPCCAMHNTLNYSPGHCELWFFGWTHRYYRKTFPLYPLPISVFIPYIISSISRYCPESNFIKFRLFPQLELSGIKNKNEIIEIPFLTHQNLTAIQNKALDMCPDLDFCQLTEYKCRPHIKRYSCDLDHMHIKCSIPSADRFCSSVVPSN